MLPEPRLARQIVETLGQSGTPLSKGVSYYNAGNESLLNAIDTHYLGSYLADGGAVFKLVVGDYGTRQIPLSLLRARPRLAAQLRREQGRSQPQGKPLRRPAPRLRGRGVGADLA